MKARSLQYGLNDYFIIPIGKYVLVFLLCFCIDGKLLAQNTILDRQVALPELNVSIEEFLKILSNKGGFSFTYNNNNLPTKKKVHITQQKQSVREFLNDIFENVPVQYVEKNNKIILILKDKNRVNIKPNQTIRGMVIDSETREPLIGANIIASDEDTLFGTATNSEGIFRFSKLAVGRYTLKFSCIGYEGFTISDILLGSGKEKVFNITLKGSPFILNAVNISSSYYRDKPLNETVVVSSRSFSAAETENYPGALMDISRAAVSFPGVVSGNDGQNHIIIRGNSPKGMQWRLEGIEMPNLNHFAEIGASGGGIGIVSNNMLANSEFLTGAFPAEYGNALSGIFDLNLRTGNNEKHEKTFQIGLLGTEMMIEGPISKTNKSSYIAQYRYSTFKLIEKLYPNLPNMPDFQDLSFKIKLPTTKAGEFSIFGIGGLSHEEGVDINYDWRSNMGTIGISNDLQINERTYLKSILAFSGWKYVWDESSIIGETGIKWDNNIHSNVSENSIRASFLLNRVISPKHMIRAGIIFNNTFYNTYMRWHSDSLYNWARNPSHSNYIQNLEYDHVNSDDSGVAATGQAYVNWNFSISENLTTNIGLHALQFYLNNNYSIEPRFGLSWEFISRHTLNVGIGVHSRLESITLYTGSRLDEMGNLIQPNINLGLTKSVHYILGYNYRINDDLYFKMEGYYQDLYNIPIIPYPNYFSLINMDYGFEGNMLVNEGTAYNKGIELTLEKFFSKGYYFLVNGTIYDSKYKNYLGEEFDSKYNGSYAVNAVILKEFYLGKKKQNVLGISTRCIFAGGLRHFPIDLGKSISNGYAYYDTSKGYSFKSSDYFRMDLQFSFKRNKLRYSSELRLDITNITSHKNMLGIRYDNSTQSIDIKYQNMIIPVLSYRIMF